MNAFLMLLALWSPPDIQERFDPGDYEMKIETQDYSDLRSITIEEEKNRLYSIDEESKIPFEIEIGLNRIQVIVDDDCDSIQLDGRIDRKNHATGMIWNQGELYGTFELRRKKQQN